MNTRIRGLVMVAFLGILFGCASTGDMLNVGNVVAGVQAVQKVNEANQTEFTSKDEYYVGRSVAANLLSTRKAWRDQKATTYLNVMERTLSIFSDRPETYGGYHLLILDTDEINAFSAPGGLIFVSRGLLRCATSEDMVAAILAHETSHVVLQHGLNAIKAARQSGAWKNAAFTGVAIVGSPEFKQAVGLLKDSVSGLTDTLVNSGYSRDLEFQADQMALVIMRRAGYDPRAFDDMLKLMEKRLKPGGLDFAKTHPNPPDREAAVEKALAGQSPVVVPPAVTAARRVRFQAALATI
jgi:predicted Zn-dependent protease